MKFSTRGGLTLIELLVVLALISIVGVYSFSSYRSFGQDQNLKNAVLDVVSILKQAQANAGTNTICNTQYGAVWQVELSDTITIKLNCLEGETSFTKKTLVLNEKDESILIESISGTSCPSGFPLRINFAPLGAGVSFPSYERCSALTATLTNGRTYKSLTIEKGGRIYGQ